MWLVGTLLDRLNLISYSQVVCKNKIAKNISVSKKYVKCAQVLSVSV